MKNKLLILSTGFALFSMFFGSGNLVFPLMVGQESGGHFLSAFLGILFTGVIVPLLGVVVMMFFKGDTNAFFGSVGQKAAFWFSLCALALMGPFGVLARCITVAHGSFRLLFPDTSLIAFSVCFCILIYFVTIKKHRIVSLLGVILTPFLLLSLMAITGFGVAFGHVPETTQAVTTWHSFKNGFLQGYQTMDLLAAFFFSSFIIKHLEKKASGQNSSKSQVKLVLQAGIVGGGLLALVYLALVTLGSMYSVSLENIPPQELLGTMTYEVMGPLSAPVVCVAVIFACLTTAVVLAALFAEFFKTQVTKDKISDKLAMITTLGIALLISTLEFSGIAKFLSPILEAVYPALITLTLLSIASALWGFKRRSWPVLLTLVAKICCF